MPEDQSIRELFERCVAQQADSLYRVAFRLTGTRHQAEELVQETYLNAWRGSDSIRDTNKLRGWMFSILRNQYLKSIRGTRKSSAVSGLAMSEIAEATSEDLETKDQVQTALSRLNDEQKIPLLLVTMEDFTVAEAAEILQIPKGTVLSRLHRGKQRLREILETESLA